MASGHHIGQCWYRIIPSVQIVQLAVLNDSIYSSDPIARSRGVSKKMGAIRYSKKGVTKALVGTEKKRKSLLGIAYNQSSINERTATHPIIMILQQGSRAKIHFSQCHQKTLKKYCFDFYYLVQTNIWIQKNKILSQYQFCEAWKSNYNPTFLTMPKEFLASSSACFKKQSISNIWYYPQNLWHGDTGHPV